LCCGHPQHLVAGAIVDRLEAVEVVAQADRRAVLNDVIRFWGESSSTSLVYDVLHRARTG
jgi:hypothetical protein